MHWPIGRIVVVRRNVSGTYSHDRNYFYRVPKMFDYPHIKTMGLDENRNPFVRYQMLPADLFGHRCNTVKEIIQIQPTITMELWNGMFHCTHCKLMGNIETMRMYGCK